MSAVSDSIGRFLEGAVRFLDSRKGRVAFWIFVAIFGLGLGFNTVLRAEFPHRYKVKHPHYNSPTEIGRLGESADDQAEWRSSEFRAFRAIAWGAVVEKQDPYTFPHVRAYPPFFAIAFFPFAVFWRIQGLGSGLFFLISYVGGLLTAWSLARWWQAKGERLSFGLFALIWLVLAPFMADVVVRCETDMLIVTPIALALLLLLREGRGFWSGALLGYAASFKVLPGLFGPFLLLQRRWRPLLGMTVSGLLCMVVLPVAVWGIQGACERYDSWYEHVIAPTAGGNVEEFIGGAHRSTNQSLTAALHRYLTSMPAGRSGDTRQVNVLSLSNETAQRIATVLKGIIGLGLVLLWIVFRRRDESPATVAILFATVPLGILLLSDISITTHHVTLIVPCAVIIVRALGLEDEVSRKWLWAVAAALVLCLLASFPTIKMLSPMLAATVLLLVACAAIAFADRNSLNHH